MRERILKVLDELISDLGEQQQELVSLREVDQQEVDLDVLEINSDLLRRLEELETDLLCEVTL